ncbi:MAG: hypothetical protein JWM27_2148 [Gemmatimonadetes bacterium]|nr:hypothetical protein [Gemmatimonadota bacterium]
MSPRVRLLVLAASLGVVAAAAPKSAEARSVCADKCDHALSWCLTGGGGGVCYSNYDHCINTC